MAAETKNVKVFTDLQGYATKAPTSPDPSGKVATFDAAGNLAVSAQTVFDPASPGSIGETAPGTVRSKVPSVYVVSSRALTAAECCGTIVSNYGMTDADCIADLPAAVEGLSFVCILPAVRARYFRLRCPSAESDKIYLLGVAGSDDGYVGVASGYAAGTAASFFAFKTGEGAYDWFCVPIFGTWVAG